MALAPGGCRRMMSTYLQRAKELLCSLSTIEGVVGTMAAKVSDVDARELELWLLT